jgi:hypothetical protein
MPVLQFWLNAFIPFTVAGYTRVLSTGVHVGKSAIPLPGAARLWPGNTFKHTDAGYLTDQRTFDSTYGASSRMTSMVQIETDTMAMIQQAHTTSGTTQVDLVTGAQTGYAPADMSRCGFTAPPRPEAARGLPGAIFTAGRGGTTMVLPQRTGSITLQLSAAAGDPLVGMAADIDYAGTLTVSRPAPGGAVTVQFDGTIDDFPAYDCYASLNGRTQVIFTSAPPAGNTVMDLLGVATRPVTGRVTF